MNLEITADTLREIKSHGETVYPEEGAGLLLGFQEGEARRISAIYRIVNSREQSARYNRYLLTPLDYARGEQEASRLGFEVLGVFHSHPDHPSRPSEFDREWAMPWFLYIITRVDKGQAASTQCWQLKEDRSGFEEVDLTVAKETTKEV